MGAFSKFIGMGNFEMPIGGEREKLLPLTEADHPPL